MLVENLVRGQLAVPKSAVVIRDNQEVLFRLGPENKAMWTYVNVVMSNSDSHVVAPNLDKGAELNAGDAVSYTHLDVYKRQAPGRAFQRRSDVLERDGK